MPGYLSGRPVAVVGATGFIGSHLVERLAECGAKILALARSRARLANLAAVDYPYAFAECDAADLAGMTAILADFSPEIVYYLAGHSDASETFEQMATCVRVNTLGVISLLEAASSCGTGLFVYGDSSKVYGSTPDAHEESHPVDPVCSYAISKLAGWQMCKLVSRLGGMSVVGVRPEFTYGPRQSYNLITHVRDCAEAGRPIRLMGGGQTRDPLYVGDLVDALIAIPEHREAAGHSISVGGGHEISVCDLCREVLDILGVEVAIEANGQAPRPTEIWRSLSGNRGARGLLGWSPRTPLREGLRRTLFEDGLSAPRAHRVGVPRSVRPLAKRARLSALRTGGRRMTPPTSD